MTLSAPYRQSAAALATGYEEPGGLQAALSDESDTMRLSGARRMRAPVPAAAVRPELIAGPPLPYTSSRWVIMNVLIPDEQRVFVEAQVTKFADWLWHKFGITPIMLPLLAPG